MKDHRTNLLNAAEKIKPEKNSGLNEIRTHDLRDTGAALEDVRSL